MASIEDCALDFKNNLLRHLLKFLLDMKKLVYYRSRMKNILKEKNARVSVCYSFLIKMIIDAILEI